MEAIKNTSYTSLTQFFWKDFKMKKILGAKKKFYLN